MAKRRTKVKTASGWIGDKRREKAKAGAEGINYPYNAADEKRGKYLRNTIYSAQSSNLFSKMHCLIYSNLSSFLCPIFSSTHTITI